MLRLLSISILIFLSQTVFAYEDKVAVVVDNSVITEKEILDRKNFFLQVQGAGNLNPQEQMLFKQMAIQSLVDEILLDEQVEKYSFKIAEKDIDNFILAVEQSRKLEPGFFKKKFSSNKGVYASFLRKIRGDFIKTKINNEVLMRGINVSNSEVEEIALRYAGKDALINIREFSINSDTDKAYAQIRSAIKTNKDCNKPVKSKELMVNSWQKKLSELPSFQKELLLDLKFGEFSAVVNKDNNLYVYQLCGRKVENITTQENDNLMNFLGNKKLNFKTLKYIETMRSQAYVKYM